MKSTEPEVTICVVNWNDPVRLRECLQSLRDIRPLNLVGWEVVLVDNGSSDDSVEMVKTSFPEVHVFAFPENVALAKAYNTAIRHGQGRYSLILNNDIILVEDCVQRMVDFLKSVPEAGAVAARLSNPDGSVQVRYYPRFLPTSRSIFAELFWIPTRLRHLVKSLRKKNRWDPAKPSAMEQVPGACLMVRREVFAAIGLLDEGFRLWYEDVDFCIRCKKAGWDLWYLPAARVLHVGGASARFMPMRQISFYGFNSLLRYVRKHFSRGRALVVQFLIVFVLLMRLPVVLLLEIHPNKSIRKKWKGTHTVYLTIVAEILGLRTPEGPGMAF